MLADEGLNIFDHPSFKSMLFIHCADSDVEGTYPSLQERGNISKETTEAEMVSIEGMDEEQRRVWGINYLGGEVNAIELAVTGFGAPSPDEWVQRYREAKGLLH